MFIDCSRPLSHAQVDEMKMEKIDESCCENYIIFVNMSVKMRNGLLYMRQKWTLLSSSISKNSTLSFDVPFEVRATRQVILLGRELQFVFLLTF